MRNSRRLGLKCKILSNLTDQRINQKLTALDLTATQSTVLGYITRSQAPLYQKDIEKRFHMRHPTVTGIIQRLEDKGFIECSTDERDRRLKRIYPTQKCIDHHRSFTAIIAEWDAELSAPLTDEEVQTLQTLLDKVLTGLGLPRPPEQEEGDQT